MGRGEFLRQLPFELQRLDRFHVCVFPPTTEFTVVVRFYWMRDDRPVNLVLRVGSADGRALWDSIGADGPCGREEPTPAAPAPARQEQWAACEDDEYVDWAVCDDDDDADHAWEGADAYGAYDM